jgi:IS30 family transposase
VPTEVEKRFEAVRQAARLAIEKPAKVRRSIKTQLILDVREDIATMRAKDWSWADIAAEFHPTIGASAETIRQVIVDAASTKKTRKSTPTTRKPVEKTITESQAPEKEPEPPTVQQARPAPRPIESDYDEQFGPPES